jgi:hypothetical protein
MLWKLKGSPSTTPDMWATASEPQGDIVRELIHGSAGLRDGVSNLPDAPEAWWAGYRERLERIAREAGR